MLRNNLEKESYLGEVFCLDTHTRKVVAKGFGQINLVNLNLAARLDTITAGAFNHLLVIIKTSAGYIAPFALYSEVLFPEAQSVVSYDMRAYLHWSTNYDIMRPLDRSPFIDISIRAKHAQDSTRSTIHVSSISEELIRHAVSTKLGFSEYRDCRVSVSSGYATSRYTEKVRGKSQFELDTFIRYRFEWCNKTLSFNDIGKILLAFELYWICYFDFTDCNITSIKLGRDIELHLGDKNLYATSINDPEYRSILRAGSELYIEPLAKIAHFFLNPDRDKKLGASSKIGLAFSRIIDYRFRAESELVSMNIASLIFALQSLSEGVAEQEIQKANRAHKQQTMAGIKRVMEVVKSLEGKIPDNVSQFYNRPENEIYNLLSRPPFIRSLEISLIKLNIDIKPYRKMLKSIDSARRQIVHSEGYSAEFILGLLAQTITQMEIGAKVARAQDIVRKDSDVDKLYNLLRLMAQNYFKNR